MSQVDFIRGKTRLYGIVGDPIEQVRSPQTATFEFHQRGVDAILVPMHIQSADFDSVFPQLLKMANLDGLVLTIPFKARALPYITHVGEQAAVMGAVNTIARRSDGSWAGEMMDGLGCVGAFAAQGHSIAGKSLMLMGLGGAGGAIAAAMAAQRPKRMRIFDLDGQRCEKARKAIEKLSPDTQVEIGAPSIEGMDILLNATPIGMLNDTRLPIDIAYLPKELIVFDVVVIPEETPLIALARRCGCPVVLGNQMVLAQMPKIVDFLLAQGKL